MIKGITHNPKAIIDGWKNFYLRKVDIEKVADYRRVVCMKNRCGNYDTQGLYISCNGCGCPIEKKIRSLRSDCPEGLWGHVKKIDLIISGSLFDKSDFFVDKVLGDTKFYRHKKQSEVVIIFNTRTGKCSNGNINFEFWSDIEKYYFLKTGKILNYYV